MMAYAHARGYLVRYMVMFPTMFFGDAPYWLKLTAYLFALGPLLGAAALARRREQKRGPVILPTFIESLARSHADIPKRILAADLPGIVGVLAAGELRACHFLVSERNGVTSVVVVSRWWPYRVRKLEHFSDASAWRHWAKSVDARVLPGGAYAGAVFQRYFENHREIFDDYDGDRV
ncbi:hypothetical protein [Microbacterium sp.]|uniref:hypothetical protein n=1 Tax=Microbacterium sp. TaxID=51671 RepID=UPI0028124932|nr:hypothetical protein [Microbacterium sp.]